MFQVLLALENPDFSRNFLLEVQLPLGKGRVSSSVFQGIPAQFPRHPEEEGEIEEFFFFCLSLIPFYP